MNVLVIEDAPTDMKLVSLVLQMSGHIVHGETSAEQAVKSIKQDKPEVILLDLNLPGMDGLSLSRLLKADPETRHIPIVAITAVPEIFQKEKALAAGCDAYIIKPIDTRTLSDQVVNAALRKRD